MLKNLRTDTYLHSLLLPSRVRAPHIRTPLPLKNRIAFIDLPVSLTFNPSCSDRSIASVGADTRFNETLAGDFQTPRLLSTIAYAPATAPLGGITSFTP